MVESSAEDFFVLETFAPLKFQPGKTRNKGVAIFVHESQFFQKIEFEFWN